MIGSSPRMAGRSLSSGPLSPWRPAQRLGFGATRPTSGYCGRHRDGRRNPASVDHEERGTAPSRIYGAIITAAILDTAGRHLITAAPVISGHVPPRCPEMPPNGHQLPVIAAMGTLQTRSKRGLQTREQRTRTLS